MVKQLALVLPVYNEEECIARVMGEWRASFERLQIDFVAIVLNDGSRDKTWDNMQAFADDPRFELINQANRGHGPTISRGYRRAVTLAEWVFQCDSDDEMPATSFHELWGRREANDAVFGYRAGRAQDAVRKLVTRVSRLTVRTLFGSKIRDVNSPYRLMNAGMLEQILRKVPEATFAPNVLIAGGISLGPWRVAEIEVPHRHRRTGSVSLFRWGLMKAAMLSFGQTLRYRAGFDAREYRQARPTSPE